jgi:hypothetical protein
MTQPALSQRNNSLLLCLLLCLLPTLAPAQNLVGIKGGYVLSNVGFQPDAYPEGIKTAQYVSLRYTHYHSMWNTISIFGLQLGLDYAEQGFSLPMYQETMRYKVVELPVISQFHIDFWKMRLLVNVGGFLGYRFGATIQKPDANGVLVTGDYVYDCYDKQFDYGFIGGGGLAFKIKPFEIHAECNYQHSLSMLYNPRKYSNTSLLYVYPKQLIFSLSLYYQL